MRNIKYINNSEANKIKFNTEIALFKIKLNILNLSSDFYSSENSTYNYSRSMDTLENFFNKKYHNTYIDICAYLIKKNLILFTP